MKCENENCKHEEKFHAIPDNHVLGTNNCTKFDCNCKEFKKE